MVNFRELARVTRRLERAGFEGAVVHHIGGDRAEVQFEYPDHQPGEVAPEGLHARSEFPSSVIVEERDTLGGTDNLIVDFTLRLPAMDKDVYSEDDAQSVADRVHDELGIYKSDAIVVDGSDWDGANEGWWPHVTMQTREELRPHMIPRGGSARRMERPEVTFVPDTLFDPLVGTVHTPAERAESILEFKEYANG